MCISMVIGCRNVFISSDVLPIADSFAMPTAAEPSVDMVFKSLKISEPEVIQALL